MDKQVYQPKKGCDYSPMPYLQRRFSQTTIGVSIPRQQTSLAPRWPDVDPVGSTLDQRGPNVPCYLSRAD